MTEPRLIIALRFGAVLLVLCGVPLLWHAMTRLPWQADCVIAAVASVLFAYRFERQEQR